MSGIIMVMILITAWYCSADTNAIFSPERELLALKFMRELESAQGDEDNFKTLEENSDKNIVNLATQKAVMDILFLPMFLFSPYPLSGIIVIVFLVHMLRNSEYKKKGENLKTSTIRKWGIISNLLVIAFMIFAYVTGSELPI